MRKIIAVLLGLATILAVSLVGGAVASAAPYPPAPHCPSAPGGSGGSGGSGGPGQPADSSQCQAVLPTKANHGGGANQTTEEQAKSKRGLAYTGAPVLVVAGIAVVVLAGGIVLTVAARRRPSTR